MKVFISWSGQTGRSIAETLHSWLPNVLQAAKPFFSPDDLIKGGHWSREIATELEASQVGIIIVTPESLTAPWVMFEAGALSKNVGRARVAPILFGLEPADVQGPLMQFQHAKFEKAEMKRVMRMLNSELKDASLTENVLDSVLEMWWPVLDGLIGELLALKGSHAQQIARPDRELLEEILILSRSIAQGQPDESVTQSPRWEKRESLSGALSVMEVLSRLNQGGNLAGVNLMGLNLAKMNMSRANLRGANLIRANLSGTSFENADLYGANFEAAVLNEANFYNATISRSNFWRASMQGVLELSAVKSMDEANFFEATLSDADKQMIARHRTLSLRDYEGLFSYYLAKGLAKSELRDIFLWTAHPYPGDINEFCPD